MTRSRYDYGSEGAATQDFIPDTDNAYDLGGTSFEWKNLYLDGTANIDALVADTADINGGTVDGVTIGTNSACTSLVVENSSVDGGSGSSLGTASITEEVEIAVGSGLDPVVVTSGNLAPANSIIRAVAARVTVPPDGGATTLDIGRTNGGNLDEFIDGMSTADTTTANHVANNDGVITAADMWQAAADTLTLTTDADVTGATTMKVRIVVYYDLITAPTS